MREQSVHSGASIILKIDGQEIGRAQGIDGRRSFGTEGLYELGSIMPQEHVFNRYEGSVSLEKFYVKNKSLKDLGLLSLGADVLKRDKINIEVLDKETGAIVRTYRGCSAQDYSESFRVGAISGENATFAYLEASDGKDTSSE